MKIKEYKLEELLIGKDFFEDKNRKTYKIFVYIVIIAFLLILIFSFYFKIDLKIKGIGIIEEKISSTIIKNPVNGRVIKNNMHTGKKVKKGDLLIKLEDDFERNDYEISKKKLEKLKNFYNYLDNKNYELDSNIIEYKLNLEKIKIKIESQNLNINKLNKNLNNSKKLLSLGGIAKIEIDNLNKELEENINNKKILINEFKTIENMKKEEILNEIINLESKLKNSIEILEKLNIISPIDGVIEVINTVNEGEYINNEVLARIIPENNEYLVKVYIDEKDIINVKKGMEVNHIYKNNNNEDLYFRGKVKYISNLPVNYNNKSYYFLISSINNSDNIILKNGQTLETSIIYDKKKLFKHIINVLKK